MNQNAVETKNNLLEAFLRIYSQKPLSQITVKDVCGIAGYNRTTFYNHFNDMPDLLEQIENETLAKFEAIVSRLTAKEILETDAMFLAIKGIYQGNHQSLALLLAKPDSHLPQKLKALMVRTINGFCHGLTPDDSKKLNVAITYHFSAVIGVMSHYFCHQDSMALEEMIDYVKEFSREGILTVLGKMVQ